MEETKKELKQLLLDRALLKQDVFQNTKDVFKKFKDIIREEVESLRESITDERVRLKFVDKGDFEVHAYVGSDVLVFHMHTNIFRFKDEHPLWKSSYLKNDPGQGYCGTINVYNFLADSFLQGRMNDPGFLIGRVLVNKDNHFMVEGKGQLGFLFRDFVNLQISEEIIADIVERAFIHAIEFDLISPPFDKVSVVNVMQIKALSSSLQMKTSKRLGFKFEAEDDEII